MSSSNNNKATASGNAAVATGAGRRGAAARVNPDMEIYNRFGGSAAAGKEQEKRFVKYGFLVDVSTAAPFLCLLSTSMPTDT